ncbi:MAG: Ig-like domain-containing protein [Eubacterium sp.]|nr:Ig-like domain-containing protein [Eubacterium sp.]
MFQRFFKRSTIMKCCSFLLAAALLLSSITCIVQAADTEVYSETKTADTLNPDIDTVIQKVRSYILSKDSNPDSSGTWNVIGINRSSLGASTKYNQAYYENVYTELESKNWVLTTSKYTEYSKLILGLTAIGKDATNINGHNLLSYLSDFSKVTKQGFNGPVWALIALNCHPSYSIPTKAGVTEQTTEEGLIQYLLAGETTSGGWALSGDKPDADVTGMTIQALSAYYGKRDDVTGAIDRALLWLSESQMESGGYGTMDEETAESAAQIITALASIGLDPAQDERFIKNGKWPLTGLFQYYLPEGGFMHVAGGVVNGIATEQGLYATVAYKRMQQGKTFLYDMSDLTLTKGTKPASAASTTTSANKQPGGSSSTLTKKVTGISLDYSSISVVKGSTKKLTATVRPSNATNKKVTWTSSNKKIATVTQTGKVKGIKAGTAKITVKAKDGSGEKAVCTVTVKNKTTTAASTTAAQKKTASATTRSQTKTLGTSTGSTAAKTASGKTAGTATTAKKAGTTEASDGDWSFSGEDYVPETGTVEDTEETMAENAEGSERLIDKTITLQIPVGPIIYMGLGALGLGGIELILWFLRKKRRLTGIKRRRFKINDEGGEK